MNTLIVTGGSRGIGAALSRLAARQFSIAVNYVKDKTAAELVVREITSAGGRAAAIQADVGRESDIVYLFQEAERRLGPIGCLVNNAGITGGLSRVEAVSAEMLANVFSVNISGTVLCPARQCGGCLRDMAAKAA